MSSTPTIQQPWRISFDRAAQIKAAIVAALFVLVFHETIRSLAHKWLNESDWSHGAIIPFFSAYLVAQKWDRIRKCPIQGAWLGLPILVTALGLYIFNYTDYGIIGMGGMWPYSMLLALLGVIILLCGVPVLRYAWLPWAYLLFAIPLPKGIYFALTDPLRRFAAYVATAILGLIPDLDVERVGSMIEYYYQGNAGTIGVADACSGMRSTITLCALGVAIAYVTERAWWQRLILVLACIPIATFCNLIRVIITCLLHIFVDSKYAEGTYHMMLGILVLLLALGMFSALGWFLNNLVVEVEEEEAQPATGGAS